MKVIQVEQSWMLMTLDKTNHRRRFDTIIRNDEQSQRQRQVCEYYKPSIRELDAEAGMSIL